MFSSEFNLFKMENKGKQLFIIKLDAIDNKIANNKLMLQQLKTNSDAKRRRIRSATMNQFYLSLLLQSNRTFYRFPRESCFWERDVPNLSEERFKDTFRMSRRSFARLCDMLACLAKEDNNFQKCIPLPKRIAVALYALKSSAEYLTLSQLFSIGKSTVCVIVIDFCDATWQAMYMRYISPSLFANEIIAESVCGFEDLGFPQCYGAIDGCHIEVHPPAEEATDYHNYKGWYSTVLLAVVDSKYRFIYINVGSPGRCNDSSIFERSSFKQKLCEGVLRKQVKNINGRNIFPFLIGDSAFRLSEHVMKPYPFSTAASEYEKNFNYCLSKCRRVVENAFGHLKSRFRRIGKGIDNNINNVNKIVKACCILHNFLIDENDVVNDQWLEKQNNFESTMRPQPQDYVCYDYDSNGKAIRDCLAEYLLNNKL